MPQRHQTIASLKEASDVASGRVSLDVREKEEYDAEHIPGAVWIPHSKLKENDKEAWNLLETLSKTHKNVFTYCGAGHRSGFIATIAQEKGFSNVFNLDGFSFWKLKFPIIKGKSDPDKEAKIIVGAINDPKLGKGELVVTVIACGFPAEFWGHGHDYRP